MAKKKSNVIIKKKIIKDSKQDKVSRVMREYKEGKLKDSHGNTVTDKDQALAIALSEAGLSRKGLVKAEILNKIKVYKTQVKKMIQKEEALEQTLISKIVDFFKMNPVPSDADVHLFAEKNNIAPDKLEQVIYMILSDVLTGGLSKGENMNFDPEELRMGMIVEQEHSSIPEIQRKIAYDHLAENPKYYSEGKEKGIFPELAEKKKGIVKRGHINSESTEDISITELKNRIDIEGLDKPEMEEENKKVVLSSLLNIDPKSPMHVKSFILNSIALGANRKDILKPYIERYSNFSGGDPEVEQGLGEELFNNVVDQLKNENLINQNW